MFEPDQSITYNLILSELLLRNTKPKPTSVAKQCSNNDIDFQYITPISLNLNTSLQVKHSCELYNSFVYFTLTLSKLQGYISPRESSNNTGSKSIRF